MKDRDQERKEKKLVGNSCVIGEVTHEKLMKVMHEKKLSFSILLAIALDHEFERDEPFSYDVGFPEEDYEEYTFVEQAGKILNYLRVSGGMALEMLVTLRAEIGVPDKEEFLLGFREAWEKGLIEPYTPKSFPNSKLQYDENSKFFRVKGIDRKTNDKTRKKATKFDMYQKLKKQFEGKV